MANTELTAEKWDKMYRYLRTCPGIYVKNEASCKQFIGGLCWLNHSGAQWRLLPKEFGHWNSVYKRFERWESKGIWEKLHAHFAGDPDLEYLMIDSTVIRAHPCAAGAAEKKDRAEEQELGRSKGGFSTKIHVAVDSLGNPLRFILTPGQRHDITQAEALIADYKADYVLADKGYDSNALRQQIKDQGAEAVIPPRANRTEAIEYDPHIYRERHLVECFFNKIKWFRRIFSRFDKLACHYLGFLRLAATLICLK